VLTTGPPELGVEEAYTSNGAVRWARTSRVPVRDENGRTVGLVGFVENASDMICRFDTELRYIYCNKAVSRETSQPLSAFLGKTPLETESPANVGRSLHDALMAAYRCGQEQRITQALTVGSSGTETTRCFDARIVPELDEDGNIESFLSIARDVTDRKNTETALQSAVEERDTLMQELNHRVKNNLAIVKSLIGLKDAELGPEIDLTDISNQVEAIRTVHEKLNTGNGASHIEMGGYLRDLLETIFASVSRDRLTITNEVEELRLPSKIAVSIGLIVNELATNALKHGLTGTAREEFAVSLSTSDDDQWYTLTVSNTGAPFPDSIDLDNPTTLGLRLVGALVTQIDGHMELRRHPHPEFTIRWSVS
jgi:PAS domain S-box-containing protein